MKSGSSLFEISWLKFKKVVDLFASYQKRDVDLNINIYAKRNKPLAYLH